MGEAVELYRQDGTATGVFYCSECRAVFSNEEQARLCHGERLCPCGEKSESRYSLQCSKCSREKFAKESRQREADRFEKAAKITEAEYGEGMVFDADQYYDSVEDAIDGYLDDQKPEYVWACRDIGVRPATLDGLIEDMLDGMWEDADHYDLNGIDELQKAVDAFNEANRSIHVWEPDYSRAILVGDNQ